MTSPRATNYACVKSYSRIPLAIFMVPSRSSIQLRRVWCHVGEGGRSSKSCLSSNPYELDSTGARSRHSSIQVRVGRNYYRLRPGTIGRYPEARREKTGRFKRIDRSFETSSRIHRDQTLKVGEGQRWYSNWQEIEKRNGPIQLVERSGKTIRRKVPHTLRR